MEFFRQPNDFIHDEISRGGIVEFVRKQIQRTQAFEEIGSRVMWELGQSHSAIVHALHVASEDFRLMFGEVDWLVGSRGPARRSCRFQEFRALSERLSMDGEGLLVGFLAGEDFESLFEVESAFRK